MKNVFVTALRLVQMAETVIMTDTYCITDKSLLKQVKGAGTPEVMTPPPAHAHT